MSFDSEDIAEFFAEETFNEHDFIREAKYTAFYATALARRRELRELAKKGDPAGIAFVEAWNAANRRRRALKAGRDPNVRVRPGKQPVIVVPERIGVWLVLEELRVPVAGAGRETTRAVRVRCQARPDCDFVSVRQLNHIRKRLNGCRKCYLKNRLAARNNLGSVVLGDLHTK